MEPENEEERLKREAAEAKRLEYMKQKTVDLKLRRPCSCGSGRKLKDCCYKQVVPGLGYVLVDVEHDNVPVFMPYTDEAGNQVADALVIPVFDSYKSANDALHQRQANLTDTVKLGVAGSTTKELEEFAHGYSDLLSQRLGREIDIYLIIPDNIETAEEEGATPEGGQDARSNVIAFNPPYAAGNRSDGDDE